MSKSSPDLAEKNAQICDFKDIASYNWSANSTSSKPVIIVPGRPDTLKRKLLPQQLRKSQHKQMCDENRHYQLDFPLESLFRTVEICSPSFKLSEVDFATDRNNLRKLMNFVEADSVDSFRIDFQSG